MAILHLEDLEGCVEVLVFPEAYRDYGAAIREDGAILVCGEVSRKEDPPKILAHEIYPLADAPRYFARHLGIHLPVTHVEDGRLDRIKEILHAHPGDKPIIVCLEYPSGEKVFLDTNRTYAVLPDDDLVHELEQELGEQSVYVDVNPAPCLRPKPARRERSRSPSRANAKTA